MLLVHLSIFLPRADLLHLLQHLLGFINIALSPKLFSLGQKLPNFLVQLMDLFCLKPKQTKFKSDTSMILYKRINLNKSNQIKNMRLSMIQSLVWNTFPLTFAATSALISSWVSARRFLASSVLRSQSAMKDSRWSTAYGSKEICYQTDNLNISLQQNTNVPNDYKNIKEIQRWLWSATLGPVCIIMIVIFPINTAWNYQAVNYQTIYSKNHLRQAQRTDLSPWRQSHNLHEVPGHGFSCTRQDPCATAKTKADISQISIRRYGIKNVIVVVQYFSYIIYCSMNSGCIWAVRPVSYVLTVPERMSWGQQFRRWLLQTRSSVNLTLCRVSSPATVQKKDQSEKPNILWEGARCQLLWQRLQ